VAEVKAVAEGRTVNLPDIQMIGAAKSGSSSLYAYLSQHPGIYAPLPPWGGTKEPRTLLCLGEKPKNPPMKIFVPSVADYLDLYRDAGERKALEGSIIYMPYHDIIIPVIKKLYPEPEKIYFIAIIRNPVDRAFSQYRANLLWTEENFEELSFEEATRPEVIRERMERGRPIGLDYIGVGLYYEQIKAYMDAFPRVKVILLDDMKADSRGTMDSLCDFLEIERFAFNFERHNVTKGVPMSKAVENLAHKQSPLSSRFPLVAKLPLSIRTAPFRLLKRLNRREIKLKPATRERLKPYFREDILKLQELIGRDLSAWLK
jgi:hypothetical protein